MNSFPEDDHRLVNFLKQNRPDIPPASVNLEERILDLVEQTPQQRAIANPSSRTRIHRSMRWFLPSAIAAGFMVVSLGYRVLMPPQPNEAELAELQEFIESTWDGTVAEYPTTTAEELYPLTDEASLN